jgi:hypothetical protein
MPAPRDIDGFLRECVDRDDPYLALPAYDLAHAHDLRAKLESVLLKSSRLRLAFGALAFTPPSFLARLALEPSEAIHLRVARNLNSDTETLDYIGARAVREDIRRALASHANASSRLLAKLETDGAESIRSEIARNPHASYRTLKSIFTRGLGDLKATIARHPNAGPELIRAIYRQGDCVAQTEAIGNANCPADLLEENCTSRDPGIRRKCAANPALPTWRRVQFLDDPDSGVRAEALQAMPGPLLGEFCARAEDASGARRQLARRAIICEALIARLSCDRDPWVRRWLARNPSTPPYILQRLSRDDDAGVRRAAGRNIAAPPALLARLVEDPDDWVRAGVADRPELPARALALLEDDAAVDVLSGVARNPKTRPEALARLAGHADASIRRAVILNPSASAAILRQLMTDDYPLNRALAVGHSSLAIDESWVCASDPEPQVRFAVSKRVAALL